MRDSISRRQRPVDVQIPSCGIYVLESHHAHTFHMEMGSWPFDKACRVAVGRGKLVRPSEAFTLQKDDFLLLPAGTLHHFVDNPSNPLTLVMACFERTKVSAHKKFEIFLDQTIRTHPLGQPLKTENMRVRTELGDTFRRMLREQSLRKAGYEIVLQTALTNLVIRIGRECSGKAAHISEAQYSITDTLQYLDEFYYKPIRLSELASYYGISVRRFTQLFKQKTGTTLIDYVNAKRIEEAKQRLKTTGHITYACLESGFNDLGYFYRVFKKYTGMTPGEYLRKR